ncbi:hypothetical protein [Micavibrio aeruginosavorus]|uniref:Uncharacterized protein n=1 Tax=Micavibrio aeruginosavorus EPB TaxID=349215 RepID=M4VYI3_9BACT|nr:hypothetical protein [Micavibrio aeruginosavorus]AGH98249.1 hypothetical protein A11S_1440 [Micavibrio aeruginosavorus EPB]
MNACFNRIYHSDEVDLQLSYLMDDLAEQGATPETVPGLESRARNKVISVMCTEEFNAKPKAPVDKYNGNFLSCTFGESGSDKVLKMTQNRLNDMVRQGVIRDSQKNDMKDDVHTNVVREVCMGMGYKP